MAYRPFLLASAAASALVPHMAEAARSGLPGSAGSPAFFCGSGNVEIGWGVAGAGAPELAYVDSQGAAGATFSFDCDNKGNFTQTIARKAGEGQKDFLKITLKEVLISSYQADGSVDVGEIFDQKLNSSLFSHKFEVFQNGYKDNTYLPLELGYKFTSIAPAFRGLPEFKFDIETRTLTGLIPLQDEEFTFSFFSPGAVPEPGTWMSMILGFAATGAAVRSKRRRRRVETW